MLCKKIGHRKGNAWLLSLLGKVYAEQGEYSTTNALFVESLELTREIGDKELIAPNLERLAEVIAELGEPVQAANLWGRQRFYVIQWEHLSPLSSERVIKIL